MRKIKGYTLVEVIIAMAILLIFVTVFSNSVYTQIRMSTANKQKLESLSCAQDILEEIRSQRDKGTWKSKQELATWFKTPVAGGGKGLTEVAVNSEYKGTDSATGNSYRVFMQDEVTNSDPFITYLVQVIVQVEPRNTSVVRLGTKFFVK